MRRFFVSVGLLFFLTILFSCSGGVTPPTESAEYRNIAENIGVYIDDTTDQLVIAHTAGETIAYTGTETVYTSAEGVSMTVYTDANFIPERIVFEDGTILIIGPVQNGQVETAFVYPDGSVEIIGAVSIDLLVYSYLLEDSVTLNARFNERLSFNDVHEFTETDAFKGFSLGMRMGGCIASTAAAVATGGAAIPLAMLSCGSLMADAYIDYRIAEGDELPPAADAVLTGIPLAADIAECFGLNPLSCANAVLTVAEVVGGLGGDVITDKEDIVIQTAEEISPPGEVTDAAIFAGDRTVDLTWVNPSDSDFSHIDIFYGITTFSKYLGTIDPNGTSITNLVNGEKYKISIHTVDNDGNSSPGTYMTATPSPGTGDQIPPQTTIIEHPDDTGTNRNVTFSWSGTDNITAQNNLIFSTYIDGFDSNWTSYSSSTLRLVSDIPYGDYRFFVRAKDSSGNVDTTPAFVDFEVLFVPPEPPSDFQVDDFGSDFVTMSWTIAPDVTDFVIQRSTNDVDWDFLAEPGIDNVDYTDNSVEPDTAYYYRIRAQNYELESTYTDSITVTTLPGVQPTPGIPGSVSVNYNPSDTAIMVTWSHASDYSSYEVERSNDGSSFSVVGTSLSNEYFDGSFEPGRTHYYRLRALNSTGYGTYSSTKSIETEPEIPDNLDIATVFTDRIYIDWKHSTGATGYRVESAASSGGPFSLLEVTGDNSSVLGGLSSGQTMYFRVQAGNNTGWSEFCGVISGTTN